MSIRLRPKVSMCPRGHSRWKSGARHRGPPRPTRQIAESPRRTLRLTRHVASREFSWSRPRERPQADHQSCGSRGGTHEAQAVVAGAHLPLYAGGESCRPKPTVTRAPGPRRRASPRRPRFGRRCLPARCGTARRSSSVKFRPRGVGRSARKHAACRGDEFPTTSPLSPKRQLAPTRSATTPATRGVDTAWGIEASEGGPDRADSQVVGGDSEVAPDNIDLASEKEVHRRSNRCRRAPRPPGDHRACAWA